MAFADPQTITISTVANTLARIAFGQNTGTFQKDDGSVKLTISHAFGKRNRSVVRVDSTKISADPFTPAINVKSTYSAYLVSDEPPSGWTVAEKKAIIDSLMGWMTASSGAATTKFIGREV